MNRFAIAALVSAFAVSSFGQAAELSFNPSPATVSQGGQSPAGACGTAVLSQNPNNVPTAGSSVRCQTGAGIPTDNSYFRAFNLGSFPQGFTSCAVEVGIESALAPAPATTQPLTVRIYSSTGAAFPAGARTQVGTATMQVSDQTLSLLTVPLTATVPAGAQLVAEVFSGEGAANGTNLFIGSNASAETGPSYLEAAGCALTAPTPTATIGFPNMHIILNVRGTDAGPAPAPVLVVSPTAGANFGQVVTGQNGTATVTLTNTGNAPATITAITAPTAPFSLVTDGCTGQTLAAGTGMCTVTYRFSPTATGPFSQTLTVTSNAPPVTFQLQGSGVAPPVAVPGPGALALLTLGLALLGFGAWRVSRG